MNARAQDIADDVEVPGGEEPSLRDTIESARDAIVERESNENKAAETQLGGPVERDVHGRFVRKAEGDPQSGARERPNAPAARAPAPAPQAGAAAPQGQAPSAPAGSPDPSILAPNSWTPAAKAKWAALDPEIRAEISRREADVHRTIARQDEERQLGNQFNEVIRANADFFQRVGVAPQRLFADYLNISKILGGNDVNAKAQLLVNAARQNGLDLRALAQMQNPQARSAQGQPPQGGQPPQPAGPIPFHLLPPEIQESHRRQQEREMREQQEAQATEQRLQQQTYEEIVSFRSQPQARFFDAVKDQMVALLQAGAAASLEEAYNQAVWTRPDIRDVLLKEEQATRESESNRRAAADKARRKGVSVRGGSGSSAGAAPADRSLREELQANFAEARSRV